MRWRTGRRSTNIQDRRGLGGPLVGGGIGAVLIAIVAMFFGVDPGAILQGDPGAQEPTQAPAAGAPKDELGDFVSVVLADTEDTWNEIFQQQGGDYVEPQLVLFDGVVQSACGLGQSAVGPFYCPRDQQVYIDLAFYEDLRQRFQAPGDFAQAYVIAHEVGHHVQNLLGVHQQVEQIRMQGSRQDANELSVRVELQADCFAGLWAHHAHRSRQILEAGDVEEALNAAAAIGDDRLQRQSGGYVSPESFTHGTSEQRARWFRVGLQSGDVRQCDTFSARGI